MRFIIILASLMAATVPAAAAEIKALITTAMDAAVVVLVPSFERTTGNKVIVSYDPSGGLARRLRGGEFADMILVSSKELDALIKEGKVKDRTDISRTGIGLAVRKGAPHPDVSTPEALKRTLLAAKSIVHTAPGNGGATSAHIPWVFAQLGIAEQLTPKIKFAAGGPNGRVSTLIANGQAEIGLQQASELMGNPDVELIGLLPDPLQQITINSAGITAVAKEPDAASALIRHFTTPEALALYKTKGLGL
jgi:molybdate transport system substrate-binding protein